MYYTNGEKGVYINSKSVNLTWPCHVTQIDSAKFLDSRTITWQKREFDVAMPLGTTTLAKFLHCSSSLFLW